MRLPHTKE